MKVAVAGKGGAGKTTICATAARLLAKSGHRVVAIDGDTNPNLHAAIGIDSATELSALPTSLVSRRFDGPRLTIPVEEVLQVHAHRAPDGVSLVRMGMPQHADEGCMCSSHAVVSAFLADVDAIPDTITLLDLEASPEHLSRGTARHCDVLLLVAEPYYRSLEAVRLQASLAAQTSIPRVAVVANKCRQRTDAAAITEFCERHELDLIGLLPWSEAVLNADSRSLPLLDHAPDDDVVTALDALMRDLVGGSSDEGSSASGHGKIAARPSEADPPTRVSV